MRQRNLFLQLLWSVAILTIISSCAKDSKQTESLTKANQESHDVASDWMHLSLELTQEAPGFTAPVATRAFAYISLGMYEVIVPGMDGLPSLQGKIKDLNEGKLPELEEGGIYNWSAAVNECMYHMFKKIYRNVAPSTMAKIEENYHFHLKEMAPRMNEDVLRKSREFGRKMGEAVYNYSTEDGQDAAFMSNYPASYKAPQGAGLWNPTNANIKKPLQPFWGKTRMFLPGNGTRATLPTPPVYSADTQSEFYAYALEVRNRVRNLTVTQGNMIEYWNDDKDGSISLAGHMYSVLLQILDQQNKDLAFAATAMVKLGLSMHDATVCAWKLKYEFNLVRPETYIKDHIDSDFLTLVTTPSTPEYSCSQSAIAMVASEVMSDIFGYTFAFTDRTHEYRKDLKGDPRSYKNFLQMADEINNANLSAGIHYRFSLEAGSRQGTEIANSLRNLRF